MQSWTPPHLPQLPGRGPVPAIHNQATGALDEAAEGESLRLYVCGITPYDATHLGHAATYLAYDVLQRAAHDAGLRVHYAQNSTDVDDPLLERASVTGVDWRELAASQIQLFRDDMRYLGALPPREFLAVTEHISEIARAVAELEAAGYAYRVPSEGAEDDIYFDLAQADDGNIPWHQGATSRYPLEQRQAYFAERGGDPARAGKRDPLDPLLWRAARPGEPSWEADGLPTGRPGWHIECSVLSELALGTNFDVQGGGSDLISPHHEMSAAHAAALHGVPLARIFNNAGMVAYQGTKMSKSLGNLVFVSRLRERGVDASALRTAILSHHYRSDWEWFDQDLDAAQRRVDGWRNVVAQTTTEHDAQTAGGLETLDRLRAAIADDLDTPHALRELDRWAQAAVPGDGALVARAAQTLLGLELAPPRPATKS